jgi:hypothetical protein
LEFDRRLVKGSSSSSLFPSRTERALIQKNASSFLYRGDASDFGHCWMESTRQKTWFDVWQTTTQPLDSGDLGIDLIISGSFGSCLSMSYSIHLRKELNLDHYFAQVSVRSVRRSKTCHFGHSDGLYFRCIMARSVIKAIDVGMGNLSLRHSRNDCAKISPVLSSEIVPSPGHSQMLDC